MEATTMIDADYIAAVEDTLSDLTGERALGAKIASDVADYHKLDLLVYLEQIEEDDGVFALDVLNQNNAGIWDNDVRIAVQGVRALRRMQKRNRELFQSRLLLEAHVYLHLEEGQGGLQILLETMKRHPLHVYIQRKSAYILLEVFMEDRVPNYVPMVTAHAVGIANCLVNVLKNHGEEFEPQRAALFTLEQAVPWGNREGFPEIIAAVARGGGIPVLFTALEKMGILLERRNGQDDDDDNDQRFMAYNQVFRNILCILRAMPSSDPESQRLLVEYVALHQNHLPMCFAVHNNLLAAAQNDTAYISSAREAAGLLLIGFLEDLVRVTQQDHPQGP